MRKKGFSLIELLIVVSIIAILTTLGLTIYTEVQKRTRDAQRKSDIASIAKALEVHYTGDKYNQLSSSWFDNNIIPQTDPSGKNYSGCPGAAASPDPVIANWPSDSNFPIAGTGGCPSTSSWAQVSAIVPVPAAGGTSWKICTRLETTAEVFCKHNVQ